MEQKTIARVVALSKFKNVYGETEFPGLNWHDHSNLLEESPATIPDNYVTAYAKRYFFWFISNIY